MWVDYKCCCSQLNHKVQYKLPELSYENTSKTSRNLAINIMIWSFAGYLQEVVYKLSKVGQAIDNNDFSTASSVLGSSSDADWVQNANLAFNKVSIICIIRNQDCLCITFWKFWLLARMYILSLNLLFPCWFTKF